MLRGDFIVACTAMAVDVAQVIYVQAMYFPGDRSLNDYDLQLSVVGLIVAVVVF